MAYDDGYYYGQCKIVAVVDNTADNGKTVLITTDDNKTYSGTIANKKCEFLLPPRTLYTVQKVSSGSTEFTTKVEAGYGDCILVHLDTGYVEVKQGDIVGLDYIKAATDNNLKNKVPEAKAVKELNNSLGDISGFTNATYDSLGDFIQYCVDNGYLPDINSLRLIPTMTSNTAPSGRAFASAEGSGHGAYKVFDNNNSTFWWNNAAGVAGSTIGYKFTKKVVVRKLEMMSHNQEGVKTFKVQASDNGSNWVDISGNLEISNNVTNVTSYRIENDTPYLYYRIYIVDGYGSSDRVSVNMRTLQFYGF